MDSPVIPGRVSQEKFTNPLQARLRQLYLDDVLSNSKEMLFFTKSKERGNKNDISFVIQNLKLSISCIYLLVNFKLISTIKQLESSGNKNKGLKKNKTFFTTNSFM